MCQISFGLDDCLMTTPYTLMAYLFRWYDASMQLQKCMMMRQKNCLEHISLFGEKELQCGGQLVKGTGWQSM
jgi:hypothetical protein